MGSRTQDTHKFAAPFILGKTETKIYLSLQSYIERNTH